MARTAEGRRLTEAHRLAQARIGARTVRQMLDVGSLLDPRNIDGSSPRWLRTAMSLIQGQRVASSQLAGGYITAFRAVELGRFAFAPTVVDVVGTQTLARSLLSTGSVTFKKAIARGLSEDAAFELATRTSARAAMRHALNGGRETLMRTIDRDERANRWARATSGKPCAFCAMLASRGAVYSSDSVDFQAHDGCACMPEPVYGTHAELPPGADQYRELWEQTGSLAEFRKAYDAAGN